MRSNLVAASTHSLLNNSIINLKFFFNEINTLQVMLCCRHKTALTSFLEVSFFCSWNAPRLRHNWRVPADFLQSSSFNQYSLNITHNPQHHLTYLIHDFNQFTGINLIQHIPKFLFCFIYLFFQQNILFLIILDNSNRDFKMVILDLNIYEF